jgi:hypothetical protein
MAEFGRFVVDYTPNSGNFWMVYFDIKILTQYI